MIRESNEFKYEAEKWQDLYKDQEQNKLDLKKTANDCTIKNKMLELDQQNVRIELTDE